MLTATAPASSRILNFVVVGGMRSGTSVVQSTISNRPGAVCHADLFHEQEAIRREAHEDYFGRCKDPNRCPEWFIPTNMSPWQYINQTVLDNPQHGETTVGLRLFYPVVAYWELWELLEQRCREGDFCVVHVLRNPIACLTSQEQAKHSGIWRRALNDPVEGYPNPVHLDPSALTNWCRQHISVRDKIRAACTDCLDVTYRDLFVNYQTVMRRIFDFLELPDSEEPAISSVRRLRNRSIDERISNWDTLRHEVPSDIVRLLDTEDLF